jgi:ubiquinone/menaquinone biosynthesis C-methylase UbiE
MAAMVKAYKGMGMEGSTARWYDRTTRKDLPEIKSLAVRIAAAIPSSAQVLEVAPGPGFLSIELAKRGLPVRALDISRTFVDIARSNAAAEGVDVRFDLGNAAALPLEDASVDFVVCRAAFKNFTEPMKALLEMRRVLRPGGKALLIDMRRDASMAEVKQYVDGLRRKPPEPLVHALRLPPHVDQASLSARAVSPHGGRGRMGSTANRYLAHGVRGLVYEIRITNS